jgi:ketosteroid isomerase-like protein
VSQENVEIVRRVIAAFNNRDRTALRPFFDHTAQITPVRAAVDGTVFSGAEAASEYCAAIDDSWDDLRWEVEDIRSGSDWVLALGHIRGRGRGSGATIDARGGWLVRLRERLIVEFRTYTDRAEALEAVGLEE